MSASPPTSPSRGASARRGGGRAAAGAAGLVALVLAAVLMGPPGTARPLDPGSAAGDGLRGLVDLAESMNGHVDITLDIPDDPSTRVLVVADRLPDDRRGRLAEWVEDGGRLIVADPDSALHGLASAGRPVTDVLGATSRSPECGLGAVDDVGTVTHAAWTELEVPRGAQGCFEGEEGSAWLVARQRGEGSVVALGSPAPLQNRSLDRGDNAVLAAALLFPEPGARVVVMPPEPADGPVDGPSDLVPDRVWQAAALLLAAAVLGIVAVGRRLGRPVDERLPPTVPSAELARSVGQLLQRAADRQGAADRLRAQARADVAAALGRSVATPGELADAAARLEVGAQTARRALVDTPVIDDDELVAVAEAAAVLRARTR